MSTTMHSRRFCIAALGLVAALPTAALARKQNAPASSSRGTTATYHAKGSFEPTNTPQPPEDKAEGSTLARMSGVKKWHGDLEGSSAGQLLSAKTDVKGSAGYVAIERVTGTLGGRRGSFVLQHMGILNRGAPNLTIIAVPDSGTGELAGIVISNFTLKIDADGKHFYEFDYTLPNSH